MNLIQRMVDHHVWLLDELTARAENLPDRVLDAPIELSVEGIDNNPTLRSLLSRLVGQLAMWNAAVAAAAYDFETEIDEPISSIQRRLAEAGPEFLVPCVRKVKRDSWTRCLSTRSPSRRRSSPTKG